MKSFSFSSVLDFWSPRKTAGEEAAAAAEKSDAGGKERVGVDDFAEYRFSPGWNDRLPPASGRAGSGIAIGWRGKEEEEQAGGGQQQEEVTKTTLSLLCSSSRPRPPQGGARGPRKPLAHAL